LAVWTAEQKPLAKQKPAERRVSLAPNAKDQRVPP
jgi:hypothetical protein